MLTDRNWIQQRNIFGAQIPQAFANNGDFFLNAVEQMAGGAENYTVHTRHSFLNGLVAAVTFGIYTPTTTTVTK